MTKYAIVTGAASGIGLVIAKSMIKSGYKVVIADIDEDSGQHTADELSAHFVQADLSKRQDCKALVEKAVDKLGTVNILINNAGYQHVESIQKFPEDTWDNMISLMLTAPFLLTKYVWPHMVKNKWGRIINMASIHAQVASANKVAYISAKHGLIGLTRTSALEGGAVGITANALCPAYVRTPLVENQIKAQAKAHGIDESDVIESVMLKSAAIKKIIEPEEVSSLVMYLCSDQAASITGASMNIDLGWTAQ